MSELIRAGKCGANWTDGYGAPSLPCDLPNGHVGECIFEGMTGPQRMAKRHNCAGCNYAGMHSCDDSHAAREQAQAGAIYEASKRQARESYSASGRRLYARPTSRSAVRWAP